MSKDRWLFRLSACLVCLIAAMSCGDDGPSEPNGDDTTPPEVIGHDPSSNDTNINLDEEVRVVFSEAMDPASAQGNVTLSSGNITSLDWLDDRTLSVDHSAWAEGIQVTVTLATGLKDVAGNGLATPYTFSFWTGASALILIATDPADGATNVTRNAPVLMLFSAEMNLTSLGLATTVSDATGAETFTFDLARGEEGWVVLTPAETFPASTTIRVSITTAAQDTQGRNLSQPASFQFMTGTNEDTTPPEIIAFEPANGSIVDPNTNALRITFSEPIDVNSIRPSAFNAELWLRTLGDPILSQNNTVLTVGLRTPLPAGLPMEITIDEFADRNGVVQSEDYAWAARVAGTADYVPVVDGARLVFDSFLREGELGNPVPTITDEGPAFMQINTQPNGTFHWAEYTDGTYSTTTEWGVFRKTAADLAWVGFHDESDPGTQDVTFTTPLPYLRFPIQLGSWSVTSSAVVGPETFDIDWTGTVVAQQDVPVASGENFLFWKDCWKVVLDLDVSSMGTPFLTRADTLWYAPTVGLVQEFSYEENTNENRWSQVSEYLLLSE